MQGLLGHCPEAKTHFPVSDRDPIQHTTRGQSDFPLFEIVRLLHIYCTKVLVAKFYYSTYICHWSVYYPPDQGIVNKSVTKRSGPYFYSKKHLEHFMTKLIEVELKSAGKTESSHNDTTHSEAHSSMGLSGVDCTVLHPRTTGHQSGFGEIFLSYQRRQEANAWPGLPVLASRTLGPIHENSQWKTFSHSRHSTVHCQELQAAVCHRVGGIIMATLRFACTLSSTWRSFVKCLIYFAGNCKEN